jgi:hypothetical protein
LAGARKSSIHGIDLNFPIHPPPGIDGPDHCLGTGLERHVRMRDVYVLPHGLPATDVETFHKLAAGVHRFQCEQHVALSSNRCLGGVRCSTHGIECRVLSCNKQDGQDGFDSARRPNSLNCGEGLIDACRIDRLFRVRLKKAKQLAQQACSKIGVLDPEYLAKGVRLDGDRDLTANPSGSFHLW